MTLFIFFLSMFLMANAAAITGAANDGLDNANDDVNAFAKKPCRICIAYVNNCAKGGKSFAQCRDEVCVSAENICHGCTGMPC